jgi:hypothetical protein
LQQPATVDDRPLKKLESVSVLCPAQIESEDPSRSQPAGQPPPRARAHENAARAGDCPDLVRLAHAGAGGTGIDRGGVADGSANLVSSVVLRGAEEALHARQMCPPCAAPAPIPPAPASDWLLRLPNRPSIRVVPITCCPPLGLQDRPLGASWRLGSPAGRLWLAGRFLAAGRHQPGKVSAFKILTFDLSRAKYGHRWGSF